MAGGGLLSLGLLLLFIAASALQADLTLQGIAEEISLDDTTTLTLATGCWNVYAVGGDDAHCRLRSMGRYVRARQLALHSRRSPSNHAMMGSPTRSHSTQGVRRDSWLEVGSGSMRPGPTP